MDNDLVKVASASDEAEAELIQGRLQTEGVPSVLRRTAGFDVPEFLAAGPRDVLVDTENAEFARELLQPAPSASSVGDGDGSAIPRSRRVLAAALVAVTLVVGALCVAAALWM